MSFSSVTQADLTTGLIGLGAFGRLIVEHLAPHVALCAYDPHPPDPWPIGVVQTGLAEVARCPLVILAVPVSRLTETVAAIAPHLRPGTLVVDVGSVKIRPVEIMRAGLPPDVEILGTHPLFGPQSAADGIGGLKIAACPVRGRRGYRAAAFLRKVLNLDVIMTTPENHDREVATVQGLTHLIARVLVSMEPLPTRMTTRSFALLMQAVEMVRHDAPGVFEAIERANPYAADVRRRFFTLAAQVQAGLEDETCTGTQPSECVPATVPARIGA